MIINDAETGTSTAEEEPSRLTRSKAIRAKCLDCMCGNRAEVRRCPSVKCPLYRYRMGKEDRGDDTEDCEETENEADADDFSENNEEED